MTFEGICAEIRTLIAAEVVKANLKPSDETTKTYLRFTQIYPLPLRVCIQEAIMAWVDEVDPPLFYRQNIIHEFNRYGLSFKPAVISRALEVLEYQHKLIYLRGAWRKSSPELRTFKTRQQRLLRAVNMLTPETLEQGLVDLIDLARNMQGK